LASQRVRPLTIVHVSTQRGWHGGEEQARLLIQGLGARGHRCLVMARRGGLFAERMKAERFEVIPQAGSGRGPQAIWKTRRALQSMQPDVVHFHDPHALSGAGLAAWRLPIAARIVARRVDFPVRSIWRYRYLADRVIAVSQAVADVCRASGLVGREVEVVYDGVDPNRARGGDRRLGRASLGISDRESLLLCVATLTDHKGHTFLLQAMPAILAQFPNVRLALAGDGELRDSLKAEAQQLGISHSVSFLGYRSDVPNLLRAADLFVMPSHLEGLCSTLIDAMFARAPIVATYAGGIPEVVGGQNKKEPPVACLVPPRDPAALAAAMMAAVRNPAMLRSMVDRAETRAMRWFTADRMVEKTLAVYRDVMERSGGEFPMSRARAA
jgi:glycosyltransferase involved in cell wall biosynthesis